MLKHYVEFIYTGAFLNEYESIEIENRNTNFEVPSDCFGFRFYDREEMTIDGEILSGNKKNISGITYFGTEYALDEIVVKIPDHQQLITNMRKCKYEKAVLTRSGNWQPLFADDIVITP